ncbi:MAG TPA: prepilin-type cleavage/methylation domain-containing protein, partial [Planctomycetaceae bacterium]|nr:prepilin-type cleavage/methylation domain-containing protein [Planctomycetaceae bacterium]
MRSGYTILELLVVTAVISIMIALALPAVQSARNSARQVQCLNNMRNVTLGILQATDSA